MGGSIHAELDCRKSPGSRAEKAAATDRVGCFDRTHRESPSFNTASIAEKAGGPLSDLRSETAADPA
jgi:hypothetical protein